MSIPPICNALLIITIKLKLTRMELLPDFLEKKYGLKTESPLEHIVFSLKHEELNLGLLKAVFEQLSFDEIKEFIEISPKG